MHTNRRPVTHNRLPESGVDPNAQVPDSPQQTGPHDRFVQVRCRGSHAQWNRHRIASSFHATVTPPPGPRHAPAERQTSTTVTAAHPLRKAGDRRPFLPTRPASGDTAASAEHNARSKAGCTRRRAMSTTGPRQWGTNAQHPESAANRQNPALLFRRRSVRTSMTSTEESFLRTRIARLSRVSSSRTLRVRKARPSWVR